MYPCIELIFKSFWMFNVITTLLVLTLFYIVERMNSYHIGASTSGAFDYSAVFFYHITPLLLPRGIEPTLTDVKGRCPKPIDDGSPK